ncbi:MAG: FAD-dependent oxidoreductase [Actinomycetota bacterium]|nr:FAD-dependent oxidoreductase [Actinomycetota bacterium]
MGERLVVIGADAAGMTAASQVRRRNRDFEVIAYEMGDHASYAACGEPYHIAGLIDPIDKLIARTPEQFARAGIELHLRHEVTAIDLDRRVVEVRDADGDTTIETGFDHLLVSTGARAFVPPMPGRDLDGVHTLRTLGDAAALRAIADTGSGNAIIVGGGFIGLEVAEAFHTKGWEVTVVEGLPAVLPRTLDGDLGDQVADAVRAMGIDVLTDAMVGEIEGADRVTGVSIDGESIPADVVVLSIGSRPVVELARDAGIPLGETGAIAVDDHQRTGIEGVWSAGDCAEVQHRITGAPVNLHLGTVANKTGRVAGVNITGGDIAFPGALGTAITRVHDLEIASTGLRSSDAGAAGFHVVDATVRGGTIAHYMPGSEDLTIRVTAEIGTGRIVGAQIVGGRGAGKRIDVFAAAIWNGMPAGTLEWVDLAYAPPFAPVWDLVAIAARKAAVAASV